MTVSLARRLTWEGVIAPEDANAALYRHVTERISFLQGLVERHPELALRLEAELGTGEAASPIVPEPELLAALPPGLVLALAALPLRRDPASSVVHVVAAHAGDTHVAAEIAYHLGAPVEVTGAPLRSILQALPRAFFGAESPRQTPALGTKVPSPSERPIPLVRVSSEAGPPSTIPHGTFIPRQAPPPVVEHPVSLVPIRPEPIIPLTRTRPGGAGSSPTSSEPQSALAREEQERAAAARAEEDASRALEAIAQASTPEEVVTAFIAGLRTVAAKVLVLSVRAKSFDGREASDGAGREAVRALSIPADRPSILQTAVQGMGYVGPLPDTPVHEALMKALGSPRDEVAAGAVMVSGRATLVYLAAGLMTTYLATRRGDQLADAAGKALARIVRERKK
jgi:hypothetical protein